eukprot:CAMPEP_0170536774 /NCGR_PEP_ID=MMETSP0209-20121228/102334_1 /TAXON_ID=665100 ORGANISM="Litonotus pictus, Strain P1" /NCGR_SAMPLE_ID=MMETSP0209 /ASSEMBLY_ACC=CAM_ASM_000301 /LENGTH=630 /DNA_ID=CAMNT_0010838175 /DNA_START=1593 /DNA_END=3485 /DNA_ORIENTATION=+
MNLTHYPMQSDKNRGSTSNIHNLNQIPQNNFQNQNKYNLSYNQHQHQNQQHFNTSNNRISNPPSNYPLSNVSVSQVRNTGSTNPPLKSILKKCLDLKSPSANQSKPSKRPIKWEDYSLEKVKIFKLTDEPDCADITEEEYNKIQEELKTNPKYRILEDMRLKEINMEKENMNKARDKVKIAQEALLKMIPQMFFKSLKEISKGEDFDQAEEESTEKKLIKELNNNSLAVNYYKDTDIPLCPTMKEEKMFDFVDEDIPKIENEFIPEEPKTNKDQENFEKTEVLKSIQEFITENRIPPEISQRLQAKIETLEKFSVEDLPELYSSINSELSHSNPNHNHLKIPLSNSISNMSSTMPSIGNRKHNGYNNYTTMGSQGEMIGFKNGMAGDQPYGNTRINDQGMSNIAHNDNAPGIMESSMNTGNNNFNKYGHRSNFYHNRNENREGGNYMGSNQNNNDGYFGKMDMTKYKTKPCKNYHGPDGCMRDIKCYFIHDPMYKGVDIPLFNPDNYREEASSRPQHFHNNHNQGYQGHRNRYNNHFQGHGHNNNQESYGNNNNNYGYNKQRHYNNSNNNNNSNYQRGGFPNVPSPSMNFNMNNNGGFSGNSSFNNKSHIASGQSPAYSPGYNHMNQNQS